jgi:hypothetical protein
MVDAMSSMAGIAPDSLLTTSKAAAALDVSVSTFRRLVDAGALKPAAIFGNVVVYDAAQVNELRTRRHRRRPLMEATG